MLNFHILYAVIAAVLFAVSDAAFPAGKTPEEKVAILREILKAPPAERDSIAEMAKCAGIDASTLRQYLYHRKVQALLNERELFLLFVDAWAEEYAKRLRDLAKREDRAELLATLDNIAAVVGLTKQKLARLLDKPTFKKFVGEDFFRERKLHGRNGGIGYAKTLAERIEFLETLASKNRHMTFLSFDDFVKTVDQPAKSTFYEWMHDRDTWEFLSIEGAEFFLPLCRKLIDLEAIALEATRSDRKGEPFLSKKLIATWVMGSAKLREVLRLDICVAPQVKAKPAQENPSNVED